MNKIKKDIKRLLQSIGRIMKVIEKNVECPHVSINEKNMS